MFLEELNELFRENWLKFLTAGYLVFWKQFPAAGYLVFWKQFPAAGYLDTSLNVIKLFTVQ